MRLHSAYPEHRVYNLNPNPIACAVAFTLNQKAMVEWGARKTPNGNQIDAAITRLLRELDFVSQIMEQLSDYLFEPARRYLIEQPRIGAQVLY